MNPSCTDCFDGAAAGYLQAVTGPLGLTVSYQRDANGRVTQLTRPDGQQVEFAYDAEGRLTSLTPPDGSAHVFTYDGNGSRTGYTPPKVGTNSSATVYHYNADLQPTEIDRPDGKSVTLNYASGKVSQITAPVGTYSYGYNTTTGQLSGITAPGGETLTYSYDGPLTTQVQWSGAVAGTVGATYNNDFAVTGQSVNGTTVSFAYDADGLLTQAGDLTLTRATDLAHITGTTLSNVTTANTYNGYGELASDSASVSGNSLFSESLTRDLAGRIIEKQVATPAGTITYGYHYDNAGRLSYVTQNGVTIASYTYDANGNRTKVTTATGTTTASYDAQDRLTTYGGNSYTYNAAGDLTGKTTTAGTTQYDYDALGNLRGVTLPSGEQITYLIDGQNRRIGKQVNGALQYGLLYQNQLNPVAMTDGQGNVIERFVYGDKANVPAYLIKGGTTYRIISDYQGSVRLVVNAATGEVAQQLDYDAFGQVTKDTAPGFQPFGYAGGLYDPDTQLIRFGARDYDAETGRWTAKDPILFAGGQTNLYGYVMDDPVNGVDLNGLLVVAVSAGAESTFGKGGASSLGGFVDFTNGDIGAVGTISETAGFAADAGVGIDFYKGGSDVLNGKSNTIKVCLVLACVGVHENVEGDFIGLGVGLFPGTETGLGGIFSYYENTSYLSDKFNPYNFFKNIFNKGGNGGLCN